MKCIIFTFVIYTFPPAFALRPFAIELKHRVVVDVVDVVAVVDGAAFVDERE